MAMISKSALKSLGAAHADAITIKGEKELLAKLEMLHKSSAYRAVKAGASKSMQVAAKAIKKAIPPKYKEARKGIGWKAAKGKSGLQKGVFRARAGVGVGVKRSKIQAAKKADRKGRKGVGIGAANFHWLVLGTSFRTTEAGRNTGSTKPEFPGFATKAIAPVKSQMLAASIRGSWASIRKDVAKGKAY
jgi:hypothetical protein